MQTEPDTTPSLGARPWSTGAIVDLLALQMLAPAGELYEAKAPVIRIVGMLTKMCE